MKIKIAVLAVVALVGIGRPAVAAIGSISLDITSNGANGPVNVTVDGSTDMTVPISVSFSTTNGTTGANRGAAGIAFTVTTGLPLIDQMPMTLSAEFLNPANAVSSTTPGAGFDLFLDDGFAQDSGDGDSALDEISGVGGFQALSPLFTRPNGAQGADLELAGHANPIKIADGLIKIDKSTPAGTYTIRIDDNRISALVWNHRSGGPLFDPADATGDTLQLIVVGSDGAPPPAGGGGGGAGAPVPDDGMTGTDDAATGTTDAGMNGTDDSMGGTTDGMGQTNDTGTVDDGMNVTDNGGMGSDAGSPTPDPATPDSTTPPAAPQPAPFSFCGAGVNSFALMSVFGLGLMRTGRRRFYSPLL